MGIYFSALWCPPCRALTPVLAQFYDDLKEADDTALEIIYASKDEDQQSFDENFGDMPWKAIPFDQGSFVQELSQRYNIVGIPTLVVISLTDGQVRDMDARSTITSNPGRPDLVLAKVRSSTTTRLTLNISHGAFLTPWPADVIFSGIARVAERARTTTMMKTRARMRANGAASEPNDANNHEFTVYQRASTSVWLCTAKHALIYRQIKLWNNKMRLDLYR